MARSVVGFITAGSGGNPTGIGNYVQQLNQANIPAVICCNDGVVGISDILNLNSSVPHVMLFRVVRDGSEQYSVPDYTLTPRDAAIKHWGIIKPFFNPEVILHKDKVWLQVVNEVDKTRSDWLGYFGVEIAKIAKAEGFKVMLFAFASGEPEPVDWNTPGMLAYLQYCATNPDQAGVALHEYSYGLAPMPEVYPFHIGRFQELYKVCDARNITRPKVIISEFGWAYTSIPDQTQVMADIAFAAELYAKFPTVLGATIWYLGGGFNGIANKVQPLIVPVTQYTLDTIFPDPEETMITVPANIRHEIHLLPQNTTITELNQVTTELHPLKTAFTFSADLCHAVMYAGNDQSKVVIWGAERWVGGIVAITKWFHDRGITNLEYRGFGGSSTPTPFSHWPTSSYLITQCFGANPENYVEFGLPGHNGIDVSVPVGTNIYAARSGTVYFVNGNVGPLGIWVGIDHGDIKTVYAHLSQALVAVGQSVSGGQLIGKSGNTGNSTGPHLHFGIKGQPYVDQQGQTWNSDRNPWPLMKNTYQPPTGTVKLQGYLYDGSLGKGSDGQAVSLGQLNLRQLPSSTSVKLGTVSTNTMVEISQLVSNGYRFCEAWALPEQAPVGNARFGLHSAADPGDISDTELDAFRVAKVSLIKVLSAHSGTSIAKLNQQHPNVPFIIRAFLDFGGRIITPTQFFNDTINDIQRALSNIDDREIWLEIANEPNLTSEGLGASWTNGAEFNTWLLQTLQLYKNVLQGVRYLYPGLSPQFTQYRAFLNDSMASAVACDGVAVHTYWSDTYSINQALIDTVDYYVTKFGNKPLWITEASHNKAGPTPTQKGNQYIAFHQALKQRPSVQGVTYFVASASNPAFGWGPEGSAETWVGTEIPNVVAIR